MRIVKLAVMMVVLALGQAAQAVPITVPTSLNPGDDYRLAFVTSGVRDSTSADIADYNAFVSAAANSVAELVALGTTWTALGSTPTVDARDNTSTVPSTVLGGTLGVPIFLLNDTKLVDSNDDLWDGTIDLPFNIHEFGSERFFNFVKSGSFADGTAVPSRELGGTSIVIIGNLSLTDLNWIQDAQDSSTTPRPFYALSDVLTVASAAAPEPSTIFLLGTGLVGLVGYSRRRGR